MWLLLLSFLFLFSRRANLVVPDENVAPESTREVTTPRAQRFKNVLPVTPRHRVQVAGKPLTPRTPRTPSTATTTRTVFTSARQLFARSADPGRLVGRDNERGEIEEYINSAIEANRGGCMYVSGPPGTGKSALVDEVCREIRQDSDASFCMANVNCASMTNAKDIYGKLIEDLCDDFQIFRKSQSERLREMFLPKKSAAGLYVVVLDEIDHLLTTDQEIMYTLFEWSLHKSSRLVLIGIANALDLTDRFMPRLKARNLKPRLLPFLPYTAAQIADVTTTRLRSLLADEPTAPANHVPFLHPAAIQLCSRKVASQSGDLRKAFDIICRTIDLLERETYQKNSELKSPLKAPLLENANLASTPTQAPTSNEYTAATAPRATVAHIARVTSSTFGNGTIERLQGLNLQQKAALCALVSHTRKQRANNTAPKTPTKSPRSNTAPTVRELFETYTSLCRRDKVLQPLSGSEFKDIIGSLETMGLVGEIDSRGRANGIGVFSTPTKSGRGRAAAIYNASGADNKALICYVGQKEIESQVSGPAEGILRALLSVEDY